VLGLPTLVLNLFSQDSHMYSGLGDNSAELAAVMMIAGILGARLLIRILGTLMRLRYAVLLVGLYVLAQGVWSQRLDGFTPVGAAYQRPVIGMHQKLENHFVNLIPAGVPVSTQDELDPHLSSRRYLYLFEDTGQPPAFPNTIYVLLDVSRPTYPLPSYQLHDQAQSMLQRGWGIQAASDGLILLRKGAPAGPPPAAFYSYAYAGNTRISHRLHGESNGLAVLGYNLQRTDQPNYATPPVAYTLYLRPTKTLTRDMQPVVFEIADKQVIDCGRNALGLAWLPTSAWIRGRAYAVRLAPMEIRRNVPGPVSFQLAMISMAAANSPAMSCGNLWQHRGSVYPLGAVNPQF
ncbi:MAG: DUF2079 domain-containing protein, partial [Chloroflexota bacterium]